MARNFAPGCSEARIGPVTAPLPGPSSSTFLALAICEASTINRAKPGDDGHTAPTDEGVVKNSRTNVSDMAASFRTLRAILNQKGAPKRK